MAETYTVSYNINVNAGNATASLNKFVTAVNKLSGLNAKLNTFTKDYQNFMTKIQGLSSSVPSLNIKTDTAKGKLSKIIRQLNEIHRLAKTVPKVNVRGRVAINTSSGGSNSPVSNFFRIPKNVGYRVLGPSMIDSGGIGLVDMMKGMGIAYGISGLGQLIGGTIKQSVEYENLMQTTKNILGAHDKGGNFEGRFANMERTVRDVGVETKYTASEVADAAKFLAMAGMDIGAIGQAIRPIADIALVGDTDLGTTADLMTNIITAYNILPSQLRHAEDIMTMTFTRTNTTIMDIAEAFKYSASLFSAAQVPFETASAALGILGDAGIKGSQAGTTMRTIMNNLVKPTKSQREAWEDLGLSPKDAEGNLRPLNEIFADLAAKGLKVKDYYDLFRLTAAQGAAALTLHVDKWNDVIKDNFLSEGMVGKLADAKKNTIQGLWYRLTSTITEGGLQAFEELEGPIKNFLRDMTSQFGSAKSTKFIKQLGASLFEFLGIITKTTKKLVGLYQQFRPFIHFWLKIQLWISMALVPLRVFRSLLNIGGLVVKTSKDLGMLALAFGKVTLFAKNAKDNVKYLWGEIGKKWQSSWKYQAINMGLGVANMAGMVGGGLLGSTVAEKGSNASAWGSVLGSLAGGLTMGLLTSGNFIAGGISAAITGITWLILYLRRLNREMETAKDLNEKWARSLKALGTDVADISTPENAMMVNMRLFTGAIKDQNTQLQLSIDLLKRYGDAQNGTEPKNPGTKFFDTEYGKKIFENFSLTENKSVSNINKELSGFYEKMGIVPYIEVDSHGNKNPIIPFNGVKYIGDSSNIHKFFAGTMGYDKNNPVYEGIERYVLSYIFKAKDSKAAKDVLQAALGKVPDINYALTGISRSEFKNLTIEEMATYRSFNIELRKSVNDMVKSWDLWLNILDIYDKGEVPDQETFEEAIGRLVPGEAFSTFSKFPHNFSDKSWEDFVDGVLKNPKNYGFGSAPEAQQAFLNVRQFLESIWNMLPQGALKDRFYSTFMNNSRWANAVGGLDNLKGGFPAGEKFGDKMKFDGTEYTWTKMSNNTTGYTPYGYWADSKGNPYAPNNAGFDTPDEDNGGANTEDYESSYKSSAAPKQVIIKIENLLNVESIDMTDPNNQETVDKLSSMLVAHLVDAAYQGGEVLNQT